MFDLNDELKFHTGGADPDQKFVDIRMKAIKHKILVLSGKGGLSCLAIFLFL